MIVYFDQDGWEVRMHPIPKRLGVTIRNMLTYTKKIYSQSIAQRRKKNITNNSLEDGTPTQAPFEFQKIVCYEVLSINGKNHLVTQSGFVPKLRAFLHKQGIKTEVRHLRPIGKPNAFTPSWKHLDESVFREKQKQLLEVMLRSERGIVCYPTGAGKSYLARLLCLALPKAKIVITTKHQAVLRDGYDSLRKAIPGVGIYCSDVKQNVGSKIMFCTTGSLDAALDWKPDLIIADEVHEMATPFILEKLSRFKHARFLGLSANYRDRLDGADFELEGLFGPLVAHLKYSDAVEAGLVVPIEVHMRNCHAPGNHRRIYNTRFDRQKFGIWTNMFRNKLIAEDARLFEDDQVLIVVNTVEHAAHLNRYLPEFKMVYGDMSPALYSKLMANGILPRNYKPLDKTKLYELKKSFESGELKKVIATSVWNRGVNFHRLQVLIRADGGSSKIAGTQIPGRLSRLCESIDKTVGILIDYKDQFNEKTELDSESRQRDYKRRGWTIIHPGSDPLFPDNVSMRRPLIG